ncbi:hypothetical protein WICMUC_005380 [Wickerhamomyces mucosus]|uniref:PX domain-containing protein n=1 Tax=Wickerhamomyces mucosus TaxID=1378264 RepID=A0A9P8P7L6_9ASCO|nr:hypothetical protein WICMUC_005380 [Wickerhamomyces mucosus]
MAQQENKHQSPQSINPDQIEDEFTDLPLDEDNGDSNQLNAHEATEREAETDKSSDIVKGNNGESRPFENKKVLNTTIAYDPYAYEPESKQSEFQHQPPNLQDINIEIIDAGKSQETTSKGYIVYTIKFQERLVRRRYSEFESLRKSLVRLFPTKIIPPIPEKHSITEFAIISTKNKEDQELIEHRRRMMAIFLKRCLKIERIANDPVFQNFLDPNSNWGELLNSPPLSQLPKNSLQSDPIDPVNNSTAAHSYLPIPTNSVVLVRNSPDDKYFENIENQAREYEGVISGGIEKGNKRLSKHWFDLSSEFSELGSEFNSFSLQETKDLALYLEKFGQTYDSLYSSTATLSKSLLYQFNEPLAESVQFGSIVKELLKFRTLKSLQLDITSRTLKAKINNLKLLEKAEEESNRLSKAIEANQNKAGHINFDRKLAAQEESDRLHSSLINNGEQENLASSKDSITPLTPKKSSSKFKIPGLSKISSYIKESIENDPEVSRQHNIIKYKEDLNQLRQTYSVAVKDDKKATEAIKEELEKFQITKQHDLNEMILSYTNCILNWSRKNLEFWEEAKEEIQNI